MAWIKIIHPEEAKGELKEEYEEALRRAGYIANILRVQSLNPASLHASILLYKSIMFGTSGVTRAEREMLATVVSQINHCFYWIESHAEDLRAVLQDDALVEEIKKDYRTAKLNERQRTLCDFAEKLTLSPAKTTPPDLDKLRQAGFSDADILDAVQVISYFNYINRIADGLGVDLEASMKRPDLS